MIKLHKHQEEFIKRLTKKMLVCWEGGTGKSIAGCLWLKDKDQDALVICPKKIIKKWQNEIERMGAKATVVSKEQFKKLPKKKWSAVICDEADEFASPLFIGKKRSQLSTVLYNLIKAYQDMPIFCATATPVRSNPANLHTLLTFIGKYIDWKKWRDDFYELQFLPYLPRPAYMPKKDWRERMRPILEKHADIVLLKDCVDLPSVIEEEILVKTPKYKKQPDDKIFFDEHRWEQQNKAKEVINIGKEFRKVLVVAYYREQIDQLEKELKKDKDTFVIHGGVKDQEAVIESATKSDDCYFIVQASIGAGFDADTFSCVVFVSMSYAVRDFFQMTYRVRRINNLHPVKYVFLIGGRCDKAVLKNVKAGFDFIPSKWI